MLLAHLANFIDCGLEFFFCFHGENALARIPPRCYRTCHPDHLSHQSYLATFSRRQSCGIEPHSLRNHALDQRAGFEPTFPERLRSRKGGSFLLLHQSELAPLTVEIFFFVNLWERTLMSSRSTRFAFNPKSAISTGSIHGSGEVRMEPAKVQVTHRRDRRTPWGR